MEHAGNPEKPGRRHCLEPSRETSAAQNGEKKVSKSTRKKPKHYYLLTPEEEEKLRFKLWCAKKDNINHSVKSALMSMVNCERDAVLFRHKKHGNIICMMFRCHKKFCPRCGIDWSKKLQDGVKKSSRKIDFEDMRHIVLTVKNCTDSELKNTINSLYSAFREWRNQGRRIKGGGYWMNTEGLCWKLEIDKKKGGLWHPHLHILVHRKFGVELRKGSKAREAWVRICKTHGVVANHASGIYIKKITSENHEREIAKYAAKPLQVKQMSSDELLQLVIATYKKRFCGSSGTLQCSTSNGRSEEAHYEMLGSMSLLMAEPDKVKGDTSENFNALAEWLSWKEECWHNMPEGLVEMAGKIRDERKKKNA